MTVENFSSVILYLSDLKTYEKRNEDSESWLISTLKSVKLKAVEEGNQEIAKEVWSYETIHDIQKNYLASFLTMKNGSFYDGWCLLERVEIALSSLQRHFSFPKNDSFKISFIEKHVEQFQSLYPYSLFISPAFLQLAEECSICGKKVLIHNSCGHRKGEIYDGEMCVYIIKDVEVLELSVVSNPVQKYSVMFLNDSETGKQVDHYDYNVVKYVINALKYPFDEWDIQKTKIRHPHTLFAHLSKNDDCPCGSGKPYGKCCLRKKDGVLRPHIKILFHSPPNVDTSGIVYPNYQSP